MFVLLLSRRIRADLRILESHPILENNRILENNLIHENKQILESNRGPSNHHLYILAETIIRPVAQVTAHHQRHLRLEILHRVPARNTTHVISHVNTANNHVTSHVNNHAIKHVNTANSHVISHVNKYVISHHANKRLTRESARVIRANPAANALMSMRKNLRTKRVKVGLVPIPRRGRLAGVRNSCESLGPSKTLSNASARKSNSNTIITLFK